MGGGKGLVVDETVTDTCTQYKNNRTNNNMHYVIVIFIFSIQCLCSCGSSSPHNEDGSIGTSVGVCWHGNLRDLLVLEALLL